MISSAVQPLARCAPRFQLVMCAVGVEHEDRVVADRVDEQPEPPLGLPQPLLGLALPGDVLALGQQVERLAGAVAHHRQRGPQVGVADPPGARGSPRPRPSRRWQRSRPPAPSRHRPPRRTRCRAAASRTSPRIRHSASLARTIRPCRVIVAMPIAASSKTLWNRSTWSSSSPWLVGARSRRRASASTSTGRRGLGQPASARPATDAHQLVDHVLERRRLGEVRRGAELEGPQRQRLLVEAAEHDDAGARGHLQHLGQRGEAVHARHRDVEQHGVGLEPAGQVDRRRRRPHPRPRRPRRPTAAAWSGPGCAPRRSRR